MNATVIVLHPLLNPERPALHALAAVLGPARLEPMIAAIDLNGASRVVICAPAAQDTDLTIKWVCTHVDELCAVPSVSLIEFGGMEEPDSWAMDVQMQMRHPSSPGLAARIQEDDLDAAVDFALAVKTRENQPSGQITDAELKNDVESFLASHNTCTLSTNVQGQAHGTPLEYRYRNGHIYILSEGGEKFAGLLLDGRVAVSIYEPFAGFARLAGMQLNGVARIPRPREPEFQAAIDAFGLSLEKIQNLTVRMNVIDIRLHKGVFIWSNYKQSGFDSRQVYCFETGE